MKRWLLISILLFPLISHAAGESQYNVSGYLAVGPGFSFPGPIRVRIYDVEFGTYGVALGTTKSFRQEHVYTQFGIGLSALGLPDFGFIAAIGTEYIILWHIGIRGELYTFFGTTTGLAYSAAALGLTVGF